MKLQLTDRFCAHAKANGAVQADYYDEDVTGLVLRVSSAGKKTWTFIFTSPLDGKRVRLALGTYPATSLGKAREKATGARALIEEGKDPRREAASDAAAQTVASLVETYLVRDDTASNRSIAEIARRLRKNVSGRDAEGRPISNASKGCIGDVRLSDLHRLDITNCIKAIVDRGAKVEANRVFEDIRAMMRWAKADGYVNDNLMEGRKKPTTQVPRDRYLIEDPEEGKTEINIMWRQLATADMRESTRRIIRLCLITGQRVSEVAGMTLEEFSDRKRLWTIPAARAKNGREHEVPLSDMALTIIREQIADVQALSKRKTRAVPPYIFPGPGGRGPITGAAVAKAIKRQEITKRGVTTILGVEPWTAHDLRRTVATHMGKLRISPFIIGHVLNHATVAKATITTLVYDHHDYLPEKREALDKWAERLEGLIAGNAAQVIDLNERKKRINR